MRGWSKEMRDQQKNCKLFNALVEDPTAVIETNKLGKNNFSVVVKNVPNVKNDDLITFVGPIWEHDMCTNMPEVQALRGIFTLLTSMQIKGRIAQLQQKHELTMIYGADNDFLTSSIEPGMRRLDDHLKHLPGYATKNTWISPFNSDEGTVARSYPRYQSNSRAIEMDLKPQLKLFGPKVDPQNGSAPVVDWKKGFVDGSVVTVQVDSQDLDVADAVSVPSVLLPRGRQH